MRFIDGDLDLRCRCVFSNLSAMRFVYRYVIWLKARLQMSSPKLSKPAPQWQKIQWKFWENCNSFSAFCVNDRLQFPTKSKTPSLNRIDTLLITAKCRTVPYSQTLNHKLKVLNTKPLTLHPESPNPELRTLYSEPSHIYINILNYSRLALPAFQFWVKAAGKQFVNFLRWLRVTI